MQIGPYEILLELGRGGMGTVYLARLRGAGGFERLVAVKRANLESAGATEARQRFLQEARLAASVHHANVVGIHQVGEDDVGPYLVCDYVEGESLARLIELCRQHGHVPTRITLRVICDALSGLAAVHDALDPAGKPMGILHRDVSIENLLVGCDGVTRLADFGIAKSTVEPCLTDAGRIHGKVLYLAPEHILGEERDRSADTYAMGVTLWIALADGLPFSGRDYDTLVQQVLSQPIPPPSGVGARIGPALDAFVTRACHRDRAQRFPSAQAMLEELESAAARECPLASHREVAAFMTEMAGGALALRRERIAASALVAASPSAAPRAPERENAWSEWATDAGATAPMPLDQLTISTRRPAISRRALLGVTTAALLIALLLAFALRPGAKTEMRASPFSPPERTQPELPAETAPASSRPSAAVPPALPPLATPLRPEEELSKPREQKRSSRKRTRAQTAAETRDVPGSAEPAAREPAAPGIATQNPYR